jgi:hypothetical protein
VSDNILEASWQALTDAINYKLLKSAQSDSRVMVAEAAESVN